MYVIIKTSSKSLVKSFSTFLSFTWITLALVSIKTSEI